MGGVRDIEIESFGRFRVLVNTEPGPAIKSRYARELLLYMSMTAGPVRREELVDQLLPDISDHRQGRRRLTREMSRVQSAFDAPLWETTSETVAVHSDVHLSSDLGRFLIQQPTGRKEDASRRRHRLATLACIADGGPLLPGHDSRWSEDIRAQVAARELTIRQDLVSSLSPADQPTALRHAQRWVELEPFADDAHRAVLRLTHAVLGPAEARRYLHDWTKLYQSELGVDPPDLAMEDLSEAVDDRPILRRQLAALEKELAQRSSAEDRWKVLLQIDDVLRIIGDGPLRQVALQQLTDLGNQLHRQRDLNWRQAEFALFSGKVDQAQELAYLPSSEIDQSPETDTSISAMEAVTRAQIHFYQGRCTEALAAAEDAIRLSDQATPGIEIEARLWVGRIFDHTGDLGAAQEASLHALDLANRARIDHYIAEALTAVGWGLAKTDHGGEAHSTLDEATELAERLECNIVRATASAALGMLNYMNRRPATAYAQLAEAAELSHRTQHVAAFARWSVNAVTPLDLLGAISLRQQHIKQVQALPATKNDRSLNARLGYMGAWIELSLDNPLAAIKQCTDALEHLEQLDEPLQQLFTQVVMTISLWEAGRTEEAVQVAASALDQSRKQDLPPYLAAGFGAALGCALVKNGSLAEGMDLLGEFMSHRNPGQILDAFEYGVYFEGASKLGMVDECQALARTTCRMVDNLRLDLTDEQWETAKKQSYYIRCLLPILDSVDYR